MRSFSVLPACAIHKSTRVVFFCAACDLPELSWTSPGGVLFQGSYVCTVRNLGVKQALPLALEALLSLHLNLHLHCFKSLYEHIQGNIMWLLTS